MNPNNATPIHYAIRYHSTEIFKLLLLLKGANINAQDHFYQFLKILFLIKII